MSKTEYEFKKKKLEEKYHKALLEEDYLGAGLIFTSMNVLANERIRELEEENKRMDKEIKEKKQRVEDLTRENKRMKRRYGREF